jgi:hypothetical protein
MGAHTRIASRATFLKEEFGYIGPETMMPLASALAAIGCVLLMFWRKILAFVRMAVGGVTRTFSRIFASSR